MRLLPPQHQIVTAMVDAAAERYFAFRGHKRE
jgi:hypothetical protein